MIQDCGQGMQRVEAAMAISVSDLKRNPSAAFKKAAGQAVAVLNHNRVMGYMVPATLYERLLEKIDDLELARIVREREDEPAIWVSLDDL